MNRMWIRSLLATLVVAMPAMSADDCCPVPAKTAQAPAPASAQACPVTPGTPGTPGTSGMTAGMPAGHPDISAMPPGHPAAGQTAMPPGHPPIGGTVDPNATGTLTIQLSQGTKDGPLPAGAQVSVELHSRQGVLKKLEGTAGDDGKVVFPDVPVGSPVQPVVSVTHAGAGYQAVGQIMMPGNPDQTIKVMVYETSESAPSWKVGTRHLMLAPAAGGLMVSDMLSLQNSSDRTWIGTLRDDGKRKTMVLPLAGVQHVQLGKGFDACCAKVTEHEVISTSAMAPGASQQHLTYTVAPQADRWANLVVKAPAPTERMMIFLPDDGTELQVEGLESMGTLAMGSKKVRAYQGAGLAQGQDITLRVLLPEAVVDAADAHSTGGRGPQVIAAAGGAGLLLLGVAAMLVKKPRRTGRDEA